jgi:hypothetical protein
MQVEITISLESKVYSLGPAKFVCNNKSFVITGVVMEKIEKV